MRKLLLRTKITHTEGIFIFGTRVPYRRTHSEIKILKVERVEFYFIFKNERYIQVLDDEREYQE